MVRLHPFRLIATTDCFARRWYHERGHIFYREPIQGPGVNGVIILSIKMATMVMAQSFWVGIFGVTLGWATSHAARYVATNMGASVSLPWELQAGAAAITLLTALVSGLFALRSLRLVEPAMLLR